MVPYPSLREKITADAVAGTGSIDLSTAFWMAGDLL